jgi:peptidyl-prolyl isomerase D
VVEAIRYLDLHWPLPEEGPEELRTSYIELFRPCLLNSALAAIKIQPTSSANSTTAVANTTRAINQFDLKPADGAKALYRRALARVQLKDDEQAEQDLLQARGLAPEDAAINAELAKIKETRKQQRDKEKKAFKKMFQ